MPSSEPGLNERNGESYFATLSLISNFLSCPLRLVGGIQVYVVSRRPPIRESVFEVFKDMLSIDSLEIVGSELLPSS